VPAGGFRATSATRALVTRTTSGLGPISISYDVSERHAHRRNLEASRDYLRAITTSITDGLLALNNESLVQGSLRHGHDRSPAVNHESRVDSARGPPDARIPCSDRVPALAQSTPHAMPGRVGRPTLFAEGSRYETPFRPLSQRRVHRSERALGGSPCGHALLELAPKRERALTCWFGLRFRD
jgi:hypothetical protein